jgi:biopolymer transport protein ExbB/TolQ
MLSIKYLGGIAFLSGLFFQTLGLYLAYQAIVEAADISPMLVMQGVFISFYTTFFGLGVFLFSLIIWYLLKVFSRHSGGGVTSEG